MYSSFSHAELWTYSLNSLLEKSYFKRILGNFYVGEDNF